MPAITELGVCQRRWAAGNLLGGGMLCINPAGSIGWCNPLALHRDTTTTNDDATETSHHVGSCCKPAFIFEVWVARTVVVAAGGLRAGRCRSYAGTRPSDRSDPSDGRRRQWR